MEQRRAGVLQLEPYVRSLAGAVAAGLGAALPEYSSTVDRRWAGECAAGTVHRAMLYTVDGSWREAEQWRAWGRRFRWMGVAAFEGGHGLLPLQRSYWAGGRTALRFLRALERRNEISAEVARTGLAAVFAVVDAISTESAEGYAAARATGAGSRSRSRKLLLRRILTGRETARSLSATAVTAGWPLPERVTAVALEPGGSAEAGELDSGILADLDGEEPCLLFPGALEEPPGFGRARAAIGPEVPLYRAAESLRLARWSLSLARYGVLPDEPVIRCDDHLVQLWLLAQQDLTDSIASRVLEPLTALTGKQRTTLSKTLLSWIATGGNVVEVARRTGAHPRTVRNRLRQLKELFGDRLDDPDARFTIEIALAAELPMP